MNIETLRQNIGRLPASKQSFAQSLVSQWDRKRRLSDKQWPWVVTLVKLAEEGEKPRETHEIGDLAGVIALFDTAGRRLKRPTVVLVLDVASSFYVRIKKASPNGRVPDSLDVTNVASGTWYGRVLRDGNFEKSPRADMPVGLIELLQRFAKDPVAVATEHGKLCGRCCFCDAPLGEGEDKRSVDIGYGPGCARNYSLPWGTTVARQAGPALCAHHDHAHA